MKQCAKCGKPYPDILPFRLDCEGYEAIAYVAIGNYVSVTYRKPPTMWKKRDE
ncbi:MAG TPA: hypothetical protein VMT72_04265 [Pseudolabrys sp.]|nr:hypothetical protein [Pseudolabrys sp.]